MKELLACEGSISGEHLISESVIRLLAGDGEFTISGTPWLAAGESKAVGPKSLTANCLCQRHNGNLHPLDDAALFLFKSIKNAFEEDTRAPDCIVSGHDLERWLLKTVKAMAASGNLAAGRQRLVGAFATDIRILDMLENIQSWPQDTGLYCVMRAGELTYNHNRFQIAPLTNESGEINGLWTDILGLGFVLLLEPLLLPSIPNLAGAVFRPGAINIQHPQTIRKIALSWADGKSHRDALSLKFLRNVEV